MFKTFNRVRKRFYWPGMRRDVDNFIEVRCQNKAPHQKHIHNLTTWEPSHPFCQVVLDIMGPLPESSGDKYILLIGDQYTKWYEANPVSNQEASTVAKAFLNVLVSRFGCPASVHSDKGSNFMSNLFRNVFKELGINRTLTTAYHPQGNGMIERTNCSTEESLAKYVNEHHNTSASNDDVQIINSLCYQVRPLLPVFKKSRALPIDCMYQTIRTKTYATLSDYVGCFKTNYKRAINWYGEA